MFITYYYIILIVDDALLSVTSRRKRYPQKGARILRSVYSHNRKSLKDLKINVNKRKLDVIETKENKYSDMELYESAAKKVKLCQNKVFANEDKTSRLNDAFKILKSAEEASSTVKEAGLG